MAKKHKKAELHTLTLDFVRSLVPLDYSKIGSPRAPAPKRHKQRSDSKKK